MTHTHGLSSIIAAGHTHNISPPYWTGNDFGSYDRLAPSAPVTIGQVDQILHDKFKQEILNGIYSTNTLTSRLTKEEPMSTIDKIRAERREKREREELEAKFEAWDAAIGSAAEGDVYAFSADMSNKTYKYAALFADKRWFLTGQTTCGMATEDFIAFLIEKDVDLQDMIFCEPLT